MREQALNSKLIESILDRISLISKEVKRKFVEELPENEPIEAPQ